MEQLEDVRERIRDIDAEIVELIDERVEAARRAGDLKREQGVGVRDYDVERAVVQRWRGLFEDEDLDGEMGEQLARLLIAEALRVQERDGLRPVKGNRGRALIVGGAGQMGAWLAHFMNGVGYEVIVHDIAGPLEGFAYTTDARGTAENCDVVIVSTPPAETQDVLEGLVGVDALVMDVASLKTPIEEQLTEMAEDQPVTSVHPLWGPGTRVLSDKNVLVLDCGHEEANEEAIELFELSAANVVEMPLDAHDPAMALTLNLPHALNLAYAEVLADSGQAFEELAVCGGPTFLKQTDVAAEVANENPQLYHQIQALNAESPRIYEALHDAIDRLAERTDDPKAFTSAMETYRDYFGEHREVIHP